mmetsp:Transcript_5903/g.7437  ORF Transcript_5903/g.7437 Transcript_5903/m.7437 type:complete len:122 (+) Transcript_5903:178-543(+)
MARTGVKLIIFIYFSIFVLSEAARTEKLCEQLGCPEGGCIFEHCEITTTCSGGNCHFISCVRPTCGGGNCIFEDCAYPTCNGGNCDFRLISVPLREGFCNGGSCTVDGESVHSSFTDRLAY